MPRAARIAAWAAAVVIGLLVVIVAVVLIGGNTGPGRRLIEREAGPLTGGKVTLSGLGGHFPEALTVARVEIHDPRGVWLTVDGVTLDWSPLALLHGDLLIDKLLASSGNVARPPVSSGGAFHLPVRVTARAIHIGHLALAAAVPGGPAIIDARGSLRLVSLTEGNVDLAIDRLDKPGHYRLSGTIGKRAIDAHLTADEPAQGLLAGIAGLPGLPGPLAITADLAGPRSDERAHLTVAAGALHAAGHGTLDLAGHTIDLDVTGAAPAMAPRADLSWRSVMLDAHVHGMLTRPDASGTLAIAGLAADGGTVADTKAAVSGDAGKVDVTATFSGIRLPGAHPDLLGAAPVQLRAEAILDRPARPITFTLSDPLVTIDGNGTLGGGIAATAAVTIPDLAPFATLAGLDLQGRAAATAHVTHSGAATTATLDGTLGLTGGAPAAVGLLGTAATFRLAGNLQGSDIALDRAMLDGKAIRLSASGSDNAGVLDFGWKLALSDLSRLAPKVTGALAAQGRITGPQHNFALTMTSTGNPGLQGMRAGTVTAAVDAEGLPGTPSGRITAQGQFAGAPVALDASAKREADGTLTLAIARALWRSAAAEGTLTVTPGAPVPVGHMHLRVARLADFAPFVGIAVGGSLDATLDTVSSGGRPQARIGVAARNIDYDGNTVRLLTLRGNVDAPTTHPVAAARLTLTGIGPNGSSAEAGINGPPDALALQLTSTVRLSSGGVAQIAGRTIVDGPRKLMRITAFSASYNGETARLLGPARIDLANGIALSGLRLGAGAATLTANGRVSPTLALHIAARNLTPALAKPFLPSLTASGTVAIDAALTGTVKDPDGNVRVTGRQLRMEGGPGLSIPPASLDARATLGRGAARLDATIAAGSDLRLRLAGTAPIAAAGRLDLSANGTLDLALVDPLLQADGRTLKGRLTLAGQVGGTFTAPRVTGTGRLAGGGFQDYVQGIHLTDMAGAITADGTTLRIDRLTARAGTGTLAIAGTVGLGGGLPADLTVTADNARLFASDRLTSDLSAALTVRGKATGRLNLAGRITVNRANINIPDKLSQSIAVLHVVRSGQAPATQAAASSLVIGLAITIDAPERVFVRGHGLDAELGGEVRVGGTTAAPVIGGGFTLRRGTFSIAGQTLTFTSGKVSFNGEGLTDKIDPTLDFVAQASSSTMTATLTVTGYADAPKIALSSVPQMPQDQVLAQLLFGQSVTQLSPFQIAEIGQALASFGGVGGGIDPLAAVRQGLGLDRLSVGGASGNTSGATVEAGKYVANGVYVGTKQGTSGGTQAQVQIDLTQHLKVETTIGTGGGTPVTGATLQNDPGSSLGLTYQRDF